VNYGTLFQIVFAAMLFSGCATFNKTQKGAAVGTVAGRSMGAIIGAAVGGTAGAVIGNQMDKQAEEIKKTVPDHSQ
jgi:uncharacterized protein YcfJ